MDLNTCLLCLESWKKGSKLKWYFVFSKRGKKSKLEEKIVKVLGLKKEDNILSKGCICRLCYRKVESYHEFKGKCLQALFSLNEDPNQDKENCPPAKRQRLARCLFPSTSRSTTAHSHLLPKLPQPRSSPSNALIASRTLSLPVPMPSQQENSTGQAQTENEQTPTSSSLMQPSSGVSPAERSEESLDSEQKQKHTKVKLLLEKRARIGAESQRNVSCFYYKRPQTFAII